MGIRVEETFQVEAPIERVWAYLIDPRQVVGCLPGAELLEEGPDRTYAGRVKQKLGPVTASFKGKAQLVEVDDVAHRMRMTANGTDTSGNGSAKMSMTADLTARGATTEVRVVAEVDLVGKLMQFGRGMVEEVARGIFRQFSDCVRRTLAAEAQAVTAIAPAPGDARAESPPSPPAAADASPNFLPLLLRAALRALGRLFKPQMGRG